MKKVIEALDEWQRRNGVSNRAVARALGLTPAALTKWKQGQQNPTQENEQALWGLINPKGPLSESDFNLLAGDVQYLVEFLRSGADGQLKWDTFVGTFNKWVEFHRRAEAERHAEK